MKRRFLITGGCGFIGTNAASVLLRQGAHVTVLDNLSRPGVERNLTWLRTQYGSRIRVVMGDVRDAHAVATALDGASAVLHLAAQVAVTTSLDRPLEDFDVNARGTLTLLEALRARPGIPLLFTSTNKVYGALESLGLEREGGHYVPTDPNVRRFGIGETEPLAFHSPYGCSKGAADQYVLDYARTFRLRAVVFRMSCIYGPHQCGNEDQGWVAHFAQQARKGQRLTLYGDGCQVRDVLYVDDLVAAMIAAFEAMPRISGEAFNIGGGPGRAVSLIDVIDELGAQLGHRPAYVTSGWRAADQRYYVSDHRKFSSATGWVPTVSPRQGLAQLLQWLNTADPLELPRDHVRARRIPAAQAAVR